MKPGVRGPYPRPPGRRGRPAAGIFPGVVPDAASTRDSRSATRRCDPPVEDEDLAERPTMTFSGFRSRCTTPSSARRRPARRRGGRAGASRKGREPPRMCVEPLPRTSSWREGTPVGKAPDVVDRHDSRVLETGEMARLEPQAFRETARLVGKVEDLDGDRPPRTGSSASRRFPFRPAPARSEGRRRVAESRGTERATRRPTAASARSSRPSIPRRTRLETELLLASPSSPKEVEDDPPELPPREGETGRHVREGEPRRRARSAYGGGGSPRRRGRRSRRGAPATPFPRPSSSGEGGRDRGEDAPGPLPSNSRSGVSSRPGAERSSSSRAPSRSSERTMAHPPASAGPAALRRVRDEAVDADTQVGTELRARRSTAARRSVRGARRRVLRQVTGSSCSFPHFRRTCR